MRTLLSLLCVLFLAALSAPAQAADQWPALAGGKCGVLSQAPMPGTDAELLYWKCPDGTEVSFHVRKAWLPPTDDASQPPAAYRAFLQSLRARSKAERMDNKLRDAIMRARTAVRNQSA